MKRPPDFLCIGAQKAGTTWLYRALKSVPGVFVPAIKELHFFFEKCSGENPDWILQHKKSQLEHVISYVKTNNETHAFNQRLIEQFDHLVQETVDEDWYRGVFQYAHQHEVCGEICPAYMGLPLCAIHDALNINPLLKILVLIRDPVDRTWSQMRMRMELNSDNIDIHTIHTTPQKLAPYLRFGDYAQSLPLWKASGSEERFKTVLFDRIAIEPESVLREILDFLEVPCPIDLPDLNEPVFVGEPLALPPKLRAKLLDELQPQYDFLHPYFPEQVEKWIAHHQAEIGRK